MGEQIIGIRRKMPYSLEEDVSNVSKYPLVFFPQDQEEQEKYLFRSWAVSHTNFLQEKLDFRVDSFKTPWWVGKPKESSKRGIARIYLTPTDSWLNRYSVGHEYFDRVSVPFSKVAVGISIGWYFGNGGSPNHLTFGSPNTWYPDLLYGEESPCVKPFCWRF